MNIGIVTAWFERGAAYVSKQFEDVLSQKNDVFIYARGGEKTAIGDANWDKDNVTWGLRRNSPFSNTLISKKDFSKWVHSNHIDLVLFNEQEWLYPLLWCDELEIPTIAYIDYYKKNTIPLHSAYSALICNTKRHYSAFDWHNNAGYLPWGTDCNIYKPLDDQFKLVNEDYVTFFHSCGMNPYRKGTDILLLASEKIKEKFKLVLHSQIDLKSFFNEEINLAINNLEKEGKLEIITKTVTAPGLYHMGDVYIYPSRLEGIGLTLAEAEACGLVPVTTNNAPMNEFVNKDIGYLIGVSKYYSREDGYYWPECLPDMESLKTIMIDICNDKEKVVKLKKANYQYSIENLNWKKNSKQIFDIIDSVKYTPLNEKIKNEITAYENIGFRRFNNIFLKYHGIMKIILNYFKH